MVTVPVVQLVNTLLVGNIALGGSLIFLVLLVLTSPIARAGIKKRLSRKPLDILIAGREVLFSTPKKRRLGFHYHKKYGWFKIHAIRTLIYPGAGIVNLLRSDIYENLAPDTIKQFTDKADRGDNPNEEKAKKTATHLNLQSFRPTIAGHPETIEELIEDEAEARARLRAKGITSMPAGIIVGIVIVGIAMIIGIFALDYMGLI